MPFIEDYGLIGNRRTAALVSRDGSIDWLCLPRFDAGACFAALLGDERHGRWRIAPVARVRRISRRYRPGTLVLETEVETRDGAVRLVDFMPSGSDAVVGSRQRAARRPLCGGRPRRAKGACGRTAGRDASR